MLEDMVGIISLTVEVLLIIMGFYQKIVVGYIEKKEPIIVEEISYKVLEIHLVGDTWHVLCENLVWYTLPWKTTTVVYENKKEAVCMKEITTIPIVTRKRWFRKNKIESLPGVSSKELHIATKK